MEISLFDYITIGSVIIFIAITVYLTEKEIRLSRKKSEDTDEIIRVARKELELCISEQTQELIAARKTRTKELERVARFGELSQGILHDLMNPLSAASLCIEQLSQQKSSIHETKDVLEKAVSASRRMRDYIDKIKTAITYHDDEKTADIASCLSTVLDLISYKARMAGVTIETHKHPPISVAIHPLRLQQLFLNIISNAIEACEHHDSTIKRVTISIDQKYDYIHILVLDTGIGIQEKHTHKILTEPFTTKKSGTGIGLMTIRSIIEEDMGGEIKIENRKEGGVRCEVKIPVTH